jgi:prevent-host-death family protein
MIDWSGVRMREIQSSEAKAHLPQLLDDVERGETLIITRYGRAIARIVPEVDRRQEEVDKVIENVCALRQRKGRVTVEQLLSAREQGRKY